MIWIIRPFLPCSTTLTRERMNPPPMLGDIDAPAEPYVVEGRHVVQQAGETGRPCGMSQEPKVHAHIHHLGLAPSLLPQHVERIPAVCEEVVATEVAGELNHC